MAMRGERFLPLACFLLQLTVVAVHGSSTEGFMSIDCGLPKGVKYNDTKTGLVYVSDHDFIDKGEPHPVSSSPAPTDRLRSFPLGSRNCYRITSVGRNKRYLVRASFLHGNYDGGRGKLPVFDLYLGTSFWKEVRIEDASVQVSAEIITTTVTDTISICLVNTNFGTPFISAIVLRPLPETLYREVNASKSMVLLDRADDSGSKKLRYPDDAYDRLWKVNYDIAYLGWTSVSTSSMVDTQLIKEYDVPPEIMKTVDIPVNESSLTWTYDIKKIARYPPSNCYFVMYFAEIQHLTANESRAFHIIFNDETVSEKIEPKYLISTAFHTIKPCGQISFSIDKTPASTLPPILNAMEFYLIKDRNTNSETMESDVEAMLTIKESYKLQRNWMGDPCLPNTYAWEGVECNYGYKNPVIKSLNLSSSHLSGQIAPSFAKLKNIEYIDLSENALTGEIQNLFAELSKLKFLNLAGNNLSGSVPKSLLHRSEAGSLMLRTEHNPLLCTQGSCKVQEKGPTGKKPLIVVAIVAGFLGLLIVSVIVFKRKWIRAVIIRKWRSHVEGNNRETKLPIDMDRNEYFTFNDLVEITKNFSKQIGRGGFGEVYHGVCSNGTQVAVKTLSHSSSLGDQQFQTEAQTLTRIHHRYLVHLIGFCDDISHLALVYEYMEGGSLDKILSVQSACSSGYINRLSWRERIRIAIEAGQGLEYLHMGCKPAIVHRDVKTSNILLTRDLEARIADFGFSKIFKDDGATHMSTKIAGTPGYLDPEYCTTYQLNEKSDVYSFGIVLLQLITGQPAILRGTENVHLLCWVKEKLRNTTEQPARAVNEIVDKRLPVDYSSGSIWKALEIAMACTKDERKDRPDMSEVVALLKTA